MAAFRSTVVAVLCFICGPALAWTHGVPTLSERSIVNADNVDFAYNYQFLNHIQVCSQGITPVDTFWYTPGNSPQWSSAILDANGWPNAAGVSGHSFGCHILIPNSTNYSTYVFTWSGEGQLSLISGTWTVTNSGSCNCTVNSNGNWTGINARVEATYSGPQQQVGWRVLLTNQTANGYFNNLKIFRAADETRLNAGGLFFRVPYLQTLVNQLPSAIRFMNWTGGNDARQNRFENRSPPNSATYGGSNWTISPPYQETSGANIMTLASAARMPVAMQHGEIATARIGSGSGLARASAKTISTITQANPGVVTATAHGFTTGDAVVFVIGAGMTQLDHWNVTATVTDADHFSIGVDTTAFTAFTAGTVMEYVSLNVGARGAFPVVYTDGQTPVATNGVNFMAPGDYRTFYFDKKISASRDGSGNPVFGTWMLDAQTNGGSHLADPYFPNAPIEICVALVNEVNALAASQGITKTIDLWINVPAWGLSSMDPDYTAASNFPVNMAKTVLAGSLGYSGLSPPAKGLQENTNERWNGGFQQTQYYARLGFLTFGGSNNDFSTYSSVRAAIMATDVRAAVDMTRVRLVIAIQGAGGYISSSPNFHYTQGNPNYFSDPFIAALPTPNATPLSYYDYMAFASYFDPSTTYMSGTGAGSFTDDSAMYAGTSPYSSPNTAQAITNFVANVSNDATGQSISVYTALLQTYAAAMVTNGKKVVQYEGAQDWQVTAGSSQGGHTLTAADSTFMLGVQGSSQWAGALVGYFNLFQATAGAGMPAIYTPFSQRWGYNTVNNASATPDDYSGGVEGAALNATWTAIGVRNAQLSP